MMNRAVFISLAAVMLAGCSKPSASSNPDAGYWTCAMHPSVRSSGPGKCPICSMYLVPVMRNGAQGSGMASATGALPELMVPIERQQQIGVAWAVAGIRPLRKTLRAVGIVEPDKRKVWTFVARTDGYVQQLFVASPGEAVEKGTPLLSLYSPDLLTAQRELLTLSKAPGGTGDLAEAARARLRQWSVSDEQIAQIERDRKTSEVFTLQSPFRGVVEKVAASQGAYVRAGEALATVADLSVVWLWADVYETDLAFLRPGQKAAVTTAAYPDKQLEGTISLIDFFFDPIKRTARARVDVPNPGFVLRPGMYAEAVFAFDGGTGLAIPVEAVMPTGARNFVFVDRGGGRLQPRSIELAGRFGGFYAVKSGLSGGERVVASANFLIDAESLVQGALKDFGDGEAPDGQEIAPDIVANVVGTCLALHRLLAGDELDGAQSLVDKLRDEAQPLPADNALRQSIDGFKSSSLADARISFGNLSAALLEVLKHAPAPRQLYIMRCTMWRSSPSEWLQAGREVENPFFGRAMAACGEVVDAPAR